MPSFPTARRTRHVRRPYCYPPRVSDDRSHMWFTFFMYLLLALMNCALIISLHESLELSARNAIYALWLFLAGPFARYTCKGYLYNLYHHGLWGFVILSFITLTFALYMPGFENIWIWRPLNLYTILFPMYMVYRYLKHQRQNP